MWLVEWVTGVLDSIKSTHLKKISIHLSDGFHRLILMPLHGAEEERAQLSALDRALVKISESHSICSEFWLEQFDDSRYKVKEVKDRLGRLMPDSLRIGAIEVLIADRETPPWLLYPPRMCR